MLHKCVARFVSDSRVSCCNQHTINVINGRVKVGMFVVTQAEERAMNELLDSYTASESYIHEYVTVQRMSASPISVAPVWAAKQ